MQWKQKCKCLFAVAPSASLVRADIIFSKTDAIFIYLSNEGGGGLTPGKQDRNPEPCFFAFSPFRF